MSGGRFYKSASVMLVMMCILFQTVWGDSPSRQDWLITGSGMGLAVGLEVFGKDHFVPETPRFRGLPRIDLTLREHLWWGSEQNKARQYSDILIYGVSLSSLVWGPVLATDHEEALFINAQVFAINSLATNMIKIFAARERPYHHFGSSSSQGAKDNTSFVSGHASVSFSQAVTNAMMLSLDHPRHKELIWSALIGSAGLTAYFRVAGDMHYFTDIVAGAALGSLIGWGMTEFLIDRNDTTDLEASEASSLMKSAGASNMLFSIRIPLG